MHEHETIVKFDLLSSFRAITSLYAWQTKDDDDNRVRVNRQSDEHSNVIYDLSIVLIN